MEKLMPFIVVEAKIHTLGKTQPSLMHSAMNIESENRRRLLSEQRNEILPDFDHEYQVQIFTAE